MWRAKLFLLIVFLISPTLSRAEQLPADNLRACQKLAERGALTEFCKGYFAAIREKAKLSHTSQAMQAAAPAAVTPATAAAIPVETPPTQQRIFVRSDLLDNRFYGFSGTGSAQIVGSGAAQGGSVSYTDNRLAQSATTGAISPTQNITVNGIASYLLSPTTPGSQFLSGNLEFASAAWVSGNGTWDQPIKKFGEISALESGFDLLFKHDGGISEAQYFAITPYYQTDFYGKAQAGGTELSGEVVRSDIYLGASPGVNNNFIDGYVAVRPEAIFLGVSNPGQTNLSTGNYYWLGGTVRAYLYLFPTCTSVQSQNCGATSPWSPLLADRFMLIGTFQYYDDAHSSAEIRYYSAELQYQLAGCKTTANCSGVTAAVSFEYDFGTNRDTLQAFNRYLAKFNVKY
jgi:hypothetical protein